MLLVELFANCISSPNNHGLNETPASCLKLAVTVDRTVRQDIQNKSALIKTGNVHMLVSSDTCWLEIELQFD